MVYLRMDSPLALLWWLSNLGFVSNYEYEGFEKTALLPDALGDPMTCGAWYSHGNPTDGSLRRLVQCFLHPMVADTPMMH